jgi:hypothetical protein
MQDYSQIAQDTERSSTAHHMADAVGYLMRVAADAGLQTIVVKLANIRANLLTLANAQPQAGDAEGGETAPDDKNLRGSTHATRKPH